MSEHSSWTNGTVTITVGENVGHWEVLEFVSRPGKTLCFCRCKCGTQREIRATVLAKGKSLGCGKCRMPEVHFKTHGKSRTPEFTSWKSMIERCYDERHPKFHRYGGRGIVVCDRWRNDVNVFIEDMGLKPDSSMEIDRFPDNNGNYEPGNCRWATRQEQMRNTCNNTLLTFDGRTKCIVEWSEETGIHAETIANRITMYGWSVERALMEKPRPLHGKPRTQYEKHEAWKAAILNSRN